MTACPRCAQLEAELADVRGDLADAKAELVRSALLPCDGCQVLTQGMAELAEQGRALRAAVRVCERAMRGDEGPDLSEAWTALHALLPPERKETP